jgi:hypothetical protein
VFGLDLWSRQKQVMRTILSQRRIAEADCHSSGKTLNAAALAIWWAMRWPDARVVTLAPGWLLMKSVLWAEIHSLLQRSRYKLPTQSINATEIKFGPKNLILGLSTNEITRLQGQHSEHLLVIIDEAPGFPEDFWPAVEGMLASGDGRLLMLGNPTIPSGPFYNAFNRKLSAWKTFSVGAFQTPNFRGIPDIEALLKLPDRELDDNIRPYLITRRWVRERYEEWWNGGVENSPLWCSRVLGQFPRDAINSLFPLLALEQARRAPEDNGKESIVIGCDPAGPGRDRTVAKACAGGAVIDTMVSTKPDSSGDVLAFIRRHQARLRIVRVDSNGLGFHLVTIILNNGFPCEGLNASSSASDKERFTNLKAERYWNLRDRVLKNEISGLSDEDLAELAAISYVIDTRGKTGIEDKASVKSALGRSPDHAEALILALGEPSYAPFRYSGLPKYERNPWPAQTPAQRASCQADDDRDDMIGGPSTFIHGGAEQMHAISAMGGRDRVRWPTFSRRRCW